MKTYIAGVLLGTIGLISGALVPFEEWYLRFWGVCANVSVILFSAFKIGHIRTRRWYTLEWAPNVVPEFTRLVAVRARDQEVWRLRAEGPRFYVDLYGGNLEELLRNAVQTALHATVATPETAQQHLIALTWKVGMTLWCDVDENPSGDVRFRLVTPDAKRDEMMLITGFSDNLAHMRPENQ